MQYFPSTIYQCRPECEQAHPVPNRDGQWDVASRLHSPHRFRRPAIRQEPSLSFQSQHPNQAPTTRKETPGHAPSALSLETLVRNPRHQRGKHRGMAPRALFVGSTSGMEVTRLRLLEDGEFQGIAAEKQFVIDYEDGPNIRILDFGV